MNAHEPEYFSKQVLSAKRFFRNQSPGDHGLQVVGGGREFCAEDFYIERESLPFLILEFVSAGRGMFEIDGKRYPLDPGTLMYYGPDHPHVISTVPGEQLHKYFVTVLPPSEIPAAELYGTVFHCSEPMSILSSFEDLIRYGENPSPRADRLCSTGFRMLMDKCQLYYVDYGEQHDARFQSFVRCKTYMRENFSDLDNLKEAAARCAVSEAYLCKLFARYDHQSPYAYLMDLRMKAAAAMILDEQKSIKEVAAQFGYTDQGHFTRAFKRVLGAAPRDFRA